MVMLGIETSCDETAAAVVEDGREILSSIVASQASEHCAYGGVVPEIASRRHAENIVGVTRTALKAAGITLEEIDALAVTTEPGLIGALLVGVNFAKGLSYAAHKPLVPVNHLCGHVASLYLSYRQLKPPFVAFVVSGGHSHLIHVKTFTEFEVMGRAIDDAAGEAFDKVARALDLPYPGGPQISKIASAGKPTYALPVPHTHGRYDVSFSGLKTAVLNLINTAGMKGIELHKENLAASFEQRVSEILSQRLVNAAKEKKVPAALCGGVAVNRALRRAAESLCAAHKIPLYLSREDLCGDNAAMIASFGYYAYKKGTRAELWQNAFSSSSL